MNPNFNDEIRYGFTEMIKNITGIEALILSEFYKILDRPIYHDTTYTASNTIKLEPNEEISDDRRPVVAFVKDISDDIIEGPSGYLSVKLDCYISGTQSL